MLHHFIVDQQVNVHQMKFHVQVLQHARSVNQ